MTPPSIVARALDGTDRSVEAPTLLTLAAFVCLVIFQGYALWKGQDFSAAAFGQALGIVMTGGGVAAISQGYLNRTTQLTRTVGNDAASRLLRKLEPGGVAAPAAKPDNPDA